MTEIADRTPTACDFDPAKRQLLADALASPAAQEAAHAFDPGYDPSWAPGAFEFAAAVRAHLPQGLGAGDFDGVNIEALLSP
jgi:hypothetical protein